MGIDAQNETKLSPFISSVTIIESCNVHRNKDRIDAFGVERVILEAAVGARARGWLIEFFGSLIHEHTHAHAYTRTRAPAVPFVRAANARDSP